MHWWLLRSHGESEAAYEEMVSNLSKQLDSGKKTLMEEHKKVTDIINCKAPNENADPQKASSPEDVEIPEKPAKVQTKVESKIESKIESKVKGMIYVEIKVGENEGAKYTLQPKTRSHCWVGRSQGRKFREKGISLPKDLEVSTTHGRFELLNNKLVYVDTGSTNGTRVGELELEPNAPVELQSGMLITVGQTVMEITLA